MIDMGSYYYSTNDLVEFTTPLSSLQNTLDSAYTGIMKYTLYSDPQLHHPVGKVFYTATIYQSKNPSISFNPYVMTIFFDDGRNVTASGAHDDSSTMFFPTGVPEKATVTDTTGFSHPPSFIEILALDDKKRHVTLKKKRCSCY